jgi:hypothetical protein
VPSALIRLNNPPLIAAFRSQESGTLGIWKGTLRPCLGYFGPFLVLQKADVFVPRATLPRYNSAASDRGRSFSARAPRSSAAVLRWSDCRRSI